MLKVMTIVGTRPELIRLSRVIARLDSTVDHVLVHTGQICQAWTRTGTSNSSRDISSSSGTGRSTAQQSITA